MNLLDRFAECPQNVTYEQLKEQFRIKTPENFNFSYDVVDEYARLDPEKRALVWCNDYNEEQIFTFKQLSELSMQTAKMLSAMGISKGDRVLLMLRRRYEFWWILLALHRIGAIAIPATIQLLPPDIVYRIESAETKMIIAFDNDSLMDHIEEAVSSVKIKQTLVTVTGQKEGWLSFHEELKKYEPSFPRPTGDAATHNLDPMLLYFTSGTSGYPKMVMHNFLYPLGHIVTAKYWQNVIDDGLHLSVAETGWGKAMWGKIYGQWIAGSAVFVYDMLGFAPELFFSKVAHYKVTFFSEHIS